MLSYTNLESEKGFKFFQDFLKSNGILDQLYRSSRRPCPLKADMA